MELVAMSVSPVLLAVSLHELVLRRVEVDHLVLPGIVISSIVFWGLVFYLGIATATGLTLSFWGSLSIWISVYRVLWHPLRHFPGPFWAKLSKWWSVKQTWDTNWHWHRVQQSLQQQYGDFVRTGPREITIYDINAIQPLLGFSSTTTRGPFYDIMEKSLHLNRDKAFHRSRRRIWDTGMKESLSGFSPIVEEITDQLLARLREDQGKPVLLLLYCNYFSYDVMSKLAFGSSMGFIRDEQTEAAASILQTFTSCLDVMGILHHMPWLMNTLGVLTSLAGPMKVWKEWSDSQMKARISRKDAERDFVGHLIKNTPNDAAGLELLYGESRLIISAGTETISTTLTLTFMQLAIHTKYLHAIRQEYGENQRTYDCQRPLPMLDAVIQESMRLWPPVLFASQRVTPPSGLRIKDNFIPGNTIVMIPPFAVNRDPRNFLRPDEFIPERWTTKRELVLNENVAIPFNTGPYSCAGKGLAYMELRSVIARVVNEFDVCLPDDFSAERYWDGVKDHFSSGPPRQTVSFVRVKS